MSVCRAAGSLLHFRKGHRPSRPRTRVEWSGQEREENEGSRITIGLDHLAKRPCRRGRLPVRPRHPVGLPPESLTIRISFFQGRAAALQPCYPVAVQPSYNALGSRYERDRRTLQRCDSLEPLITRHPSSLFLPPWQPCRRSYAHSEAGRIGRSLGSPNLLCSRPDVYVKSWAVGD